MPEYPLTSLPAWEDVDQLRNECLKRCVGTWAGWRVRIEKKGKGKMTGQQLSDWIQKYTIHPGRRYTVSIKGNWGNVLSDKGGACVTRDTEN